MARIQSAENGMLTVEQTLGAVRKAHEERPFYEHPMWSGLLQGSFNKEQVKEFVRQFGIIPLHNHNYHGRLYVNCPNPRWRARLAEVVYEEGTGRLYSDGTPHNRLYLDVGNDLGIGDEEMWAVPYCPEALSFRAYFQQMCERDPVDGISCHMLGAEAQGPGVFKRLAQRLKEIYGMTDKGVRFWVVHDEADEDHSGVGVELLEDFARTEAQRRRVIEVVNETIGMTFLLYDGIYRRMQALA